jgi:hypothetical protein
MAEQQPARQRIVVPFTGHVIGEGFNSDSVERVGTALNVGRVGEDPIAPGQTAVFSFRMLTSQASFEKSLNIGAELEARYALLSGGAKFGFAESSAVNSTSTYIVASCLVTNALRFGSDFTPNDRAAPLIRGGNIDGFKRAFGDRFTQALHTGGEFHALVRITSSDVAHQRNIAASLHAELNGLAYGASFSASMKAAREDTQSHTEVDIQIHQTGGVGEQIQIPGTQADRIRDHMNRFATAAHQSAAAYEAELLTYDTLALPFPPLMELEDRRDVLEDCLARRQRYWSAISDLTFAQSEDGDLIFEDLPPKETLVALQNAFRAVLNGLMTHARAVSLGSIEPTLFVAESEPVLPRFKRRKASSFAAWWARRKDHDPTLLHDEKVLIEVIAESTLPLLTVPLEEASSQTMERAADLIDTLWLQPVGSLAVLPSMIDAPLRKVFSGGSYHQDLVGLEPFSRLEFVNSEFGGLRDLQALASAAGLRNLYLRQNGIVDLSPLRALTVLEELDIAGNRIQSLDPLRELHALRIVSIASIYMAQDEPTVLLDNPIIDARALAELPRLANALTSTDQLRLTLFGRDGALIRSGVARRIGNTNRFQFTSDSGESEQILLMALIEWSDLKLFPTPVVVTAVHFPNAGVGAACTRPDDRSTNLPVLEVIRLFAERRSSLFDAVAAISAFGPGGDDFTGEPDVFLDVEPSMSRVP